VLVAALFMLFRHALRCADGRLNRIAYGLGLVFSAFTLVGKQLEATSALDGLAFWPAVGGLLQWLLFAAVYGAGLICLYQAANALAARTPKVGNETLFSRISGNGFVVFALLLLCWVPVWLAFWPGSFVYDSGTQFYMYLDSSFSTHHPLLHTLMLGFLMMLGIDNTADGSAAVGLAIYSVVQMVLMAGILAYACHWLRRRGTPLWARVMVTLLFAAFPFYALWSFTAQKDTLFGGLTLLFVLQLIDLWREGFEGLKKPLRIIAFAAIAVLMMLLRNNGVYALLLTLPFAVAWAKGKRVRVAALLAGCVAAYFLANGALIWATEATSPCKVEFLSIPLQQIARTLRADPAARAQLDTQGVLDVLYPEDCDPAEIYNPMVADPVKWGTNYDEIDQNLPGLLSLWARMGVTHIKPFAEAFLIQNLPYYLPGAPMLYNFDLGIVQIDLFTIDEHSYLPQLRALLEGYDQTLSLFGLPGVRLLSDTAFYVWLTLAGFGLAIYRRQKQWLAGFMFLLALWATCLVGPVAITRYMLGVFYTVPVMLAAMLTPAATKPEPETAALPKAETV